MTSTVYSPGVVVQPDWLNDVNTVAYRTQPQWIQYLNVAPVPLTSAATVNTDASLGNNFRLIAGTNFTLANPTNMTNGTYYNFQIIQDGTGSRTIAYGSKFKFPGGAAFVLSTSASAVDYISCYYDGTLDILLCVGQKGFA